MLHPVKFATNSNMACTQYNAIRNKSCCPCIHIYITGPYISFGGSILTDIYSYQPFTDYIYLGDLMMSKIYNIARIFDIFQNALCKMCTRYKELEYFEPTRKNCSRLFPRPAYLPNTHISNLVFERHLIPDEKQPHACHALFHAKYNGKPVVVKFSERYNDYVHRIVADRGWAPHLHFHTQLRGGLHMVIMDYIDGLDAYRQFEDKDLPSDVIKQVKAALSLLHNKNLVHGDIRRPNILIKMEHNPPSLGSDLKAMDVNTPWHWHAYLIDFEWVGEANKDRYTPLLNMNIPWPQGVCPGGLMKKEHDDLMLQMIICAGSHASSISPYVST